MPPRYTYWTILVDGRPTAFRAHTRDELLPTFNQLKRHSTAIEMRWFAHGKLWDSPEQAAFARRHPPKRELRDSAWRPGGQHRDRRHAGKPGRARPSGRPTRPDSRKRKS